MSLSAALIDQKHREVSGSDSFAAFEVQLIWGITLLLEQYNQNDDYAVLFEFHDDIALVFGSTTPTEIKFYQLKTKTSGNWTANALMKRTKDKSSILDKIYENIDNFRGFVTSADFVTNTYCSDLDKISHCKLSTLDANKRNALVQNLKIKFEGANPSDLEMIGFTRTELDKANYRDLIKGKIHSFLETEIGNEKIALSTCTNTIAEMCRKRQTKKANEVEPDIKNIILEKGVSRTDLKQWIDVIDESSSAPPWEEINVQLTSIPPLKLMKLRTAYMQYSVEVLDDGNEAKNSVRRTIRNNLHLAENTITLSGAVSTLSEVNAISKAGEKFDIDPWKLKAMIIYEIFTENQTGTVQEINSQS